MGEQKSPPFRRRRLGKTLRQLRESAQLTLEDVDERIELPRSRLARYETGQQSPEVIVVKAMLDLYGIPVNDWEPYLDQTREARDRGWWQIYGLPAMGYVALETAACSVHEFALAHMPGLLQTEAYVRAVLSTSLIPRSDERFENQVSVRLRRQRRLTDLDDDGLQLSAVIDESVLYRPVGGVEVLREQLDHLLIVAELPEVEVRVLPNSVGAHLGLMSAFIVLGFPEADEADVAYLEHIAGSVQIEKDDQVRDCKLTFARLRDQALSPDESMALIERVLAQI